MRLNFSPILGFLMAIWILQTQLAANSVLDLFDDFNHASKLYVTHQTITATASGFILKNISLTIFYRNRNILSSNKSPVSCYVSYYNVDDKNMDSPGFLNSYKSGTSAPDVIYLSLQSDDFDISTTSPVQVDLKRSVADAHWSIRPLGSGQKKLMLTIRDKPQPSESGRKTTSMTWINGRVVDSTDPPTIPIDVDVTTWFGVLTQLRLIGPILSFVCAVAAYFLFRPPRPKLA